VRNLRTPRRQAVQCQREWHYGTIGPRVHTDPTGPSGWRGIHGAPTLNRSGLCDDCEADLRAEHGYGPGVVLPDYTPDSSNQALRYAAERANWDDHDPWGSGMMALAAVCDVLDAAGDADRIDPGAGYSRGMVAQDTLANLAHPEDEDGADYATVNLALAVESGDVTTDDLARASRILSLYLDLVKAAGQDY